MGPKFAPAEFTPMEEAAEQKGHQVKGGAVRELILGLQDGVVSNLGVVTGVAAAIPDPRVVLISGLAAVTAEAVSMFFSQYAASKSAREFRAKELALERTHLREFAGHEREELREIYGAKGFKGKLLDDVVETITKNPDVWLATMEREEMTWIPSEEPAPLRDAALVGGMAFVAGLVPVVPFALLPLALSVPTAIGLSVATLFLAGAVMTRVTGRGWARSGFEMLLIGAVASVIGYVVGTVLQAVP